MKNFKLTVRMGYGFRNIVDLISLVMLRCTNRPYSRLRFFDPSKSVQLALPSHLFDLVPRVDIDVIAFEEIQLAVEGSVVLRAGRELGHFAGRFVERNYPQPFFHIAYHLLGKTFIGSTAKTTADSVNEFYRLMTACYIEIAFSMRVLPTRLFPARMYVFMAPCTA